MLTCHDVYLNLGDTDTERARSYRVLFESAISGADIDRIRETATRTARSAMSVSGDTSRSWPADAQLLLGAVRRRLDYRIERDRIAGSRLGFQSAWTVRIAT